jgi:thiol:disulfide interchange protein
MEKTMSEKEVQKQSSGACTSNTCCPLMSKRGIWMWVLLIGAIVYFQWPMLKGTFYKVSGKEAPASAVEWRSGLDAALAESAETGKPVLVDFTASWCPPCKVMKHEVWPDAAVAQAVNKNYIPLLVDVDVDAEVARKYGIRGIPTILVLDAKGDVLRAASFMSASGMIDFLNQS